MTLAGGEITPEHIRSLVVGEGCFYAESAPDPGYRTGWRVRPAFCIEMRADERPVLEAVQAYLGCGGIYHLDFGRYRGYRDRGWNRHAKFRVGSVRDLHDHVIPFFDEFVLFGGKRRAFQIFKPLVELIYERRHLSPEGIAEARELARRLAEHNERGTGEGRSQANS
jgi:hypothetical protein